MSARPAEDQSALVDAIASVVRGVPQVRLHEASAVGTHLPGRRVPGVRVHGSEVEVHAAVVYPTTVEEAAAAIRGALAPLRLHAVDVVIDDVVLPDDRPEPGDRSEVSHA